MGTRGSREVDGKASLSVCGSSSNSRLFNAPKPSEAKSVGDHRVMDGMVSCSADSGSTASVSVGVWFVEDHRVMDCWFTLSTGSGPLASASSETAPSSITASGSSTASNSSSVSVNSGFMGVRDLKSMGCSATLSVDSGPMASASSTSSASSVSCGEG